MGRGRQKAKNTKVARELKYFSPNTDLNALEREIGTNNDDPQDHVVGVYFCEVGHSLVL